MIMVTFTKLLDIKIVANKCSESSNSSFIFESEEERSSSISFKSEGESEKKAISEAETKPDAYNKTIANTNATIAPKEGGITVTPLHKSNKRDKYESGSKDLNFS